MSISQRLPPTSGPAPAPGPASNPAADLAGSVFGLRVNGYAIVNLPGSYDLGNGLTAIARIDNLLDRHYQDPIGFLRPGLGVFGGLRGRLHATSPGGR